MTINVAGWLLLAILSCLGMSLMAKAIGWKLAIVALFFSATFATLLTLGIFMVTYSEI